MTQNDKETTIRGSLLLVAITALIIVCFIGLGNATTPLCLSFVLTYFLFPVIKWLERHGIKRQFASLGVLALLLLVIVGVSVLVIPDLIRDGGQLIKSLPSLLLKVADRAEVLAGKLGFGIQLDKAFFTDILQKSADAVDMGSIKPVTAWLQHAFSNIFAGFLALLNLILFPMFFFYVVNDYELIVGEFSSLIPRRWLPVANDLLAKINTVLSGFIRGQLLVMLILAALYSLGLTIAGVRFGFAIGATTGLLSFIPYVGPLVGFVSSCLVVLATGDSVPGLIKVAVVFGIVQVLESYFITPKCVGDRVGLNPLTSIIAVIIGGNLLGFWGMFLAIPSFAIGKIIFHELKHHYQQTGFYV